MMSRVRNDLGVRTTDKQFRWSYVICCNSQRTRKTPSISRKRQNVRGVCGGVRDTTSQEFDVILYDMEEARVLNDTTLPALTNQSYFKDVAYIDKHPQPSSSDTTMMDLVKEYYSTCLQQRVQNFRD